MEDYNLEHHGEHYSMGLTSPEKLELFDTENVVSVNHEHLSEIQELYTASYPRNWFNPRMLETGQYVGIRDAESKLISVAGIHVYSPTYRVAALGNITTHPAKRAQGLGTIISAGLCKKLLENVDSIGLNVKADNQAAIHTYEKIGFKKMAVYHEWTITSPKKEEL
jgi:predicted GNAT family acetyltransferase